MRNWIIITLCCFSLGALAQGTSINSTGAAPDPSAGLDVDFTDKGLLPPRLTTTERDAISNPANGLMIFNTDNGCMNYHYNGQWLEVCGNCAPQPSTANAGTDQPGISGASATLAANTPAEGTGGWTVVSGAGGTFVDAADPATTFNGQAGTTYILRWTVSNSCGSNFDEVSIEFLSPFVCGTTTVSHGGETYNTVQIGTQCWFKENLNIGTMVNGSSNQTNNGIIEKYCQQNNAANCDIYGGLYQWNEMMQYTTTEGAQGICPTGWHIPSDPEWQALEIFLGMSAGDAASIGFRGTIASKLRVGGSSGFDMVMSGIRQPPNYFFDIGGQAQHWTSTGGAGNYGYWRHVYSTGDIIGRQNNADNYGHAARCIKD